ncbi:hypothetical protein BV133_3099 [Blastochloris viridis]|uniref:Flagellar hook-length control protein FliK n=1 Tax=Blastochloris viridis TaxID=1079 RepID=A0A0H5BEQ4_BLAVI|nr:hypothetical protein BV133_3099 [Blastochloris viridis]CUU42089.1 Flagellar hook-length control protein FliK [Blastochloris viridis]
MEQVTPVGATLSLPSTRGQIPALTAGQVVDARVLAVMDNGAVRLAIAGLTVEATTTAHLTVGSTVRLLAEEQGGTLKLSVIDRPQPAATSAEAMRAPGADTALAAPLARVVSTLMARQSSLAPLFADLEQMLGSAAAANGKVPTLPAEVLAAAAKVLDFRLSTRDATDPIQILTSFLRSGVFHDAANPRLATATAADGGLMQRLGHALEQVVGAQPAGGASQGAAAPQTEQGLTLRALIGLLALAEPKTAGGMMASPMPLPDLKSALADLRNAILGALGEDGARLAAMMPPRTEAARPPRRGTPPRAQPAADPLLGNTFSPGEALRTLLAETEGALARLSLAQLACSDAEIGTSGGVEKGAAPGWTFEVPLLADGRTSIAQIEIRRDESRSAATDEQVRGWSVRFSIDVDPVGPVHAMLALRGAELSVSLWAERPAAVEQLQAASGTFAALVADQDLTLERLFVRGGRPDGPPMPARHLVNRVS